MIRLRVSAQDAARHIEAIDHQRCRTGLVTHWRTGKDSNGNDQATAQSICWLFCWAKTGQNSERAAEQARHVFDAIFDRSYCWLDERLNHEEARRFRYATGFVEAEFYSAINCR